MLHFELPIGRGRAISNVDSHTESGTFEQSGMNATFDMPRITAGAGAQAP